MPTRHPFHTGFSCPNCGKQRASASANCLACRYPHHDRQRSASPNTKLARRPFQFHLWWLMAGVAVAAIFLAIYIQQENSRLMRGLAAAGMIVAIFDPVLPFFAELARSIWLEYATSRSEKRDETSNPFE